MIINILKMIKTAFCNNFASTYQL